MNRFCRHLVEYNGELVRKCDFGYLTEGQPLFVKIGLAAIFLGGFTIVGFIFVRLAFKKIKYHKSHNRVYSGKDIKILFYYIFLALVFLVPAFIFLTGFF
ncbi:MAG: hypothetical protein KBD47_03075 [Candidatus Pacebacteria bacterium]|jgi:hypothetical protein|nr:hypothetical protein [Candidatus Paceibacterota bacterium]